MATELIVIGGSAGSLQVLLDVFDGLENDFTIPFLLVLHRNTRFDSSLEQLLSYKTKIPVKEIEDKDPVKKKHIYICPADYHVLIEKEKIFSLDCSEKINYSRPSIDVVFKSAADVYGDKLVCVLLSGANADGADGLRYAAAKGGVTVVQDPKTASVSYMPEQAILTSKINYVLNQQELLQFIRSLA